MFVSSSKHPASHRSSMPARWEPAGGLEGELCGAAKVSDACLVDDATARHEIPEGSTSLQIPAGALRAEGRHGTCLLCFTRRGCTETSYLDADNWQRREIAEWLQAKDQ
jgi:hypothetical protein